MSINTALASYIHSYLTYTRMIHCTMSDLHHNRPNTYIAAHTQTPSCSDPSSRDSVYVCPHPRSSEPSHPMRIIHYSHHTLHSHHTLTSMHCTIPNCITTESSHSMRIIHRPSVLIRRHRRLFFALAIALTITPLPKPLIGTPCRPRDVHQHPDANKDQANQR